MTQTIEEESKTFKYDKIERGIAIDLKALKDVKTNIDSEKLETKEVTIKDSNRFYLSDDFIDTFRGKQPNWDVVAYITYKRTYSRMIYEQNRTEEFWETVLRVVNGIFTTRKKRIMEVDPTYWNEEHEQQLAQKLYERIWNFQMLPSGRAMWTMGTKFVEKNGSMSLCNCGFVSTESITEDTTAFEWTIDALMQGVGVGFDVRGANKIVIKDPHETQEFVIPDSREGWVKGLRLLLRAYFYNDPRPIFNYSQIRPEGTPIKGFGGVSGGSKPLSNMYDSIKKLLDKRIGHKLTSVNIVDIENYIAKCVVAGNIRRSAEIALGNYDDDEYVNCKRDKEARIDRRWASNNSVFGYEGMDYSKLIKNVVENGGEPAIIWLENAKKYSRMGHEPDFKDIELLGCNPCGEIGLESYELCNLVETFPVNHNSYEEYQETLYLAYLCAKTISLIETQWEETNKVLRKNRRIGVSQSGIIDAFNKHGRRTVLDWSKKGYEYLRNLDKEISKLYQINESIKITTVKPSGTVSLLAMVSSGIHFPHSEYYIRRITIDKHSELIPILKEAGYDMEDCITDSKSYCVVFPKKEPHFIKSKFEASMVEQIYNVIDYQSNWSDNLVSVTVTFRKEEIPFIKPTLEFCEDKLKGISMLPLEDHGYQQAPFEMITKEQYETMITKIKPIPQFQTTEEGIGENYCSGGFCKTNI